MKLFYVEVWPVDTAMQPSAGFGRRVVTDTEESAKRIVEKLWRKIYSDYEKELYSTVTIIKNMP